MSSPTARQIVEEHARLATKQFKLAKQASPETNERLPRAVALGLLGGVGLCFGGTALALSHGMVTHGSAGHVGVFVGGFAVGLAASAAISWLASDSVDEASAKLQDTNQQLDGLLDATTTRTDLPNKFSELLLAHRSEIANSLAARENLKQDIALGLAAGAAIGIATGGPGR